MVNRGAFLGPDFYTSFQCKCGECRISCCEGWDISISQQEYFDILGLETSDELQSRITRAFYIPKGATPDQYAVLNHDWLGRCPLRGDDGLCMLQVEKGESSIPDICRLYPRSIRTELGEATLSNSCEGLIELLLQRPTPIRFITVELPYESSGREGPERFALRMQCIGLLQDRNSSVRESIMAIGNLICHSSQGNQSFEENLSALLPFIDLYSEISPSLSEYCNKAKRNLAGITREEYTKRFLSLSCLPADSELILENLLVNHLFYEKFPYSESRENEEEEFISLCGLLAFLSLLVAGNAENLQTMDSMVDLLSHAFLMVEHTSFHYNAHLLLSQSGYDTPQDAMCLLSL
ncbi:MAG: flagellin lysine-N-methylase [Oscillospiraceae bacterium]|nr:flagellin lysine-N-methylase [Oscillospiraceae bacterium]